MKISELKSGQGNIDIELSITSKEDVRSFNKYGRELRVCNFIGQDETGKEIKISLWNDDIEKVNVGDKIKISNGYCSDFNGKKQISPGKYGKLEVIQKDTI